MSDDEEDDTICDPTAGPEGHNCGCPHCIVTTAADHDAMDWLHRVLINVADNGGQNAKRAALSIHYVGKLLDHARSLHVKVHEFENIMRIAAHQAADGCEAPN